MNKAIKCVSYRLSTPRLNFISLVFGQCRKILVGGDNMTSQSRRGNSEKDGYWVTFKENIDNHKD
jgi:hypothetical protein